MGNTIFKIGHEEIADISNPIMRWTTILKIENKNRFASDFGCTILEDVIGINLRRFEGTNVFRAMYFFVAYLHNFSETLRVSSMTGM